MCTISVQYPARRQDEDDSQDGNFLSAVTLRPVPKKTRGGKTIKKPYARSTETLNGDLFKKFCAVCHGRGVKGIDRRRKLSGDRLISHGWPKKGGAFPSCRSWINQRQDVVAYGSQDMPICGTSFPNEFKPGFGPRSDLWPSRWSNVGRVRVTHSSMRRALVEP